MGSKLHNLRVAVWGEAPETREEQKVTITIPFRHLEKAGMADMTQSALEKDRCHHTGKCTLSSWLNVC